MNILIFSAYQYMIFVNGTGANFCVSNHTYCCDWKQWAYKRGEEVIWFGKCVENESLYFIHNLHVNCNDIVNLASKIET